ncbi:MAG TPA: DNA repair protein RecO [Chitinivibrionales bacterium]|nr:DNA repair protein RecO [Chitinivibrionales bacterium]
MAPHKTRAFILKVNPFRESSSILYLLTEHHGLVHGVAKGVRRKKSGVPNLERGFLVELLLYARPHRELHTLGAVAVLDHYPRLRTDVHKAAVRDTAFEVMLATMSPDAPHPELFSYLSDFMALLETQPCARCFPGMAWRFLYDFSSLMGFGPNIDTCANCGQNIAGKNGAYLIVENGTLLCGACTPQRQKSGAFLPQAALALLADGASSEQFDEVRSLPGAEMRRVNRLLAAYCQYHFQRASGFKSVDFLDSLAETPALQNERSNNQ